MPFYCKISMILSKFKNKIEFKMLQPFLLFACLSICCLCVNEVGIFKNFKLSSCSKRKRFLDLDTS